MSNTAVTPAISAQLNALEAEFKEKVRLHAIGQARGETRSYRPFDHLLDRVLEITKPKKV